MNWDGVVVTPPTPAAAINVFEVTDVKVNRKSIQEAFYGDNRRFARFLRNTQKKRQLTLVLGNPNLHLGIPDDVPLTIVAWLNDANNGHGPGSIKITLVNAVLETDDTDGANNKYAGNTLTFNAYGDDSVTPDSDPLTITIGT
jgi:hypothetical protein